jgi:glycosyltransferase involved in cell wall biosynthesis
MNNILFSIVIPTYNRASFLPKAIESILEQTFLDWELIIVDDGSTDNTKHVVEKYLSDNRIIYHFQENSERSASRNKGVTLANGSFICFMDSDNYLDKNRLELLRNAIASHNFLDGVYYTDIRYEFEIKDKSFVSFGKNFCWPIDINELIKLVIATPQLCISKKVLEKHTFNPDLTVGEDMELLFRISEEYPLIYLENNATITEIEHEERSVNFYSTSVCKQLETTKIMFKKGHPAYGVSKHLKRSMIAGINLRCSYSYTYNNKMLKALLKCIVSFLIMPSFQSKHKLLIIFLIVTNQKSKLINSIKT